MSYDIHVLRLPGTAQSHLLGSVRHTGSCLDLPRPDQVSLQPVVGLVGYLQSSIPANCLIICPTSQRYFATPPATILEAKTCTQSRNDQG